MRGLPGGSWDAILGTSDYYRDRQTTQRFALLNADRVWAYRKFRAWHGPGSVERWITARCRPGRARFPFQQYNLVPDIPEAADLHSPGRISLPPGLFTWTVLSLPIPLGFSLWSSGQSRRFQPGLQTAHLAPKPAGRSLTLRLRATAHRAGRGIRRAVELRLRSMG